KALKEEINKAYGDDPALSKDFSRIINKNNFERLCNMLANETIIIGGETHTDQLYISPTVIDEPAMDGEIMKGEIFGPLLPVIAYEDEDHIDEIISLYDKPDRKSTRLN